MNSTRSLLALVGVLFLSLGWIGVQSRAEPSPERQAVVSDLVLQKAEIGDLASVFNIVKRTGHAILAEEFAGAELLVDVYHDGKRIPAILPGGGYRARPGQAIASEARLDFAVQIIDPQDLPRPGLKEDEVRVHFDLGLTRQLASADGALRTEQHGADYRDIPRWLFDPDKIRGATKWTQEQMPTQVTGRTTKIPLFAIISGAPGPVRFSGSGTVEKFVELNTQGDLSDRSVLVAYLQLANPHQEADELQSDE